MDLGRTLEEWLSNLDLGKYIDYFRNAGLTELEHCSELDDGFLHDIGISQPEHRARILQSLKLLKVDERSRSTEQTSRSGQDDYINYPTNQDDEEESIYQNVEVCRTKDLPTPCRLAPNVPAMQEVTSLSTSDVKPVKKSKKPIPRPRQSKMAKSQDESVNSSLSANGFDRVHQQTIKLDGATNGESSTDDVIPSSQWVGFQDSDNFLHGNVNNSDKRIPTVEQSVTAPGVKPDKSDLSYVNTADMAYEPIWMSSSGSRQDNQQGDLHGTEQNNVGVHSPVSPEAPPPCTIHFPFEGNSQFSFDSSASSPLSGFGASSQTSFPSPLAIDMSGNTTGVQPSQPTSFDQSTDDSSDDVNSEDPLENGTISPVGSPRSYTVEIRPTSQVDTDKDKFKFNLETKNRTFQFAAEALDDCTLWSSALMAAILKYKPPDGGEREGGDMYDPDKQGHVKFEKQDKRYVVIKQGKLCYYNTEQDFKQASPIHEIELKLASVKDLSKDKLQLSTHYAHFTLVFDNYQDCVLWRMAIEEGIATGLGDNTVLDQVRENPSNRRCADCGNEEAHWASINLGIVLCKKCAGIHRNFNSRLSRVKSLRMDTRIWTPSLIEMMKVIGNDNANAFWEKNLSDSERINEATPPDLRKTHIEDKYKRGKFSDIHAMAENPRLLNEMFLLSAGSSDVLVTMQILFSGASIMHTNSSGENAFQIAKGKGERIQMAMAAKLRSEVCLSGYLMKTGSNMKDFLKRWCILEHGCLRYYSSEKSSVAKDSIDHENMLLVHATPVERYQEAFELSTTKDKNNRIYLFAASSIEEKLTWMRTLCKLFCPVPLMEEMGQLEFTMAGTFYVKGGVSAEWEKTWLLMNKKVVQFTDKEFKLSEYIDLRKAKNIQRQESVSTCSYCIENGQCIALDIPGRAVYIQADLRRDTDRLYDAFHKEMKAGGDYLDDQQLTHDDVPIIVDRCIKFIEDNGLFEEGIYRHPGVKSKVQLLIDRFKTDAHSVVLQVGVHNVHEVASCLKQFLRGLKEPLLTTSRYRDWIENAGRQDENVKLDWYRYLIDYLPPVHNSTLKRLVRHFVKLSEHSKENKMTRENIAIAFGPSLMESGNDRVQPGSEIPLQMRVIGDIMKFNEHLFKIDNNEKDKEDKIEEAMKKIEEVSRISRVHPEGLTS
ncbi:hypothetical protein FSP39_020867 [Pinctada imbricata]|uniref:Uncharacterized protein n=1 Tax=Pinctada imbricata TaxID=66713 RepID=A0AA88YF37_PINIB|nr:hypothetical protein FSP39_020867 [Pinctada imbricata]